MFNWISIAIGSYFLNAFASVIDKALLTRRLPQPLSYAFYTGITSIGVLILIPFIGLFDGGRSFEILPPFMLFLSLISGSTFIVAFIFFYTAIKESEVMRVVPLVFGVFTPIFTLFGSWWFAFEILSAPELIAFFLFLVGGLILMIERTRGFFHVNMKLFADTLFAGLFFAIAFTSTKIIFESVDGFLTPFIWMRLGSVVFALVLLLTPWRKGLATAGGHMNRVTFGLFFINKIIGAVGFLMFKLAIKIGPVSLVNALKGLEYFFVFIIITLAGVFFPRIIKEPFTLARVSQKILGVIVISIGLLMLNVGQITGEICYESSSMFCSIFLGGGLF